ncbi:MAG: hypothetical protein ACRD3B_13475 [Candidatus Sulfotelmatobacter sp.]
MCEQIELPGGGFAIICGTRHKRQFCACGRECQFLCDWKVPGKKSGTCDKPICAQHAKQVGPEKHLCPEHQLRYDEWLKKHPPAQTSLFQESAA